MSLEELDNRVTKLIASVQAYLTQHNVDIETLKQENKRLHQEIATMRTAQYDLSKAVASDHAQLRSLMIRSQGRM